MLAVTIQQITTANKITVGNTEYLDSLISTIGFLKHNERGKTHGGWNFYFIGSV